jgi:hypothetical protein
MHLDTVYLPKKSTTKCRKIQQPNDAQIKMLRICYFSRCSVQILQISVLRIEQKIKVFFFSFVPAYFPLINERRGGRKVFLVQQCPLNLSENGSPRIDSYVPEAYLAHCLYRCRFLNCSLQRALWVGEAWVVRGTK